MHCVSVLHLGLLWSLHACQDAVSQLSGVFLGVGFVRVDTNYLE